MISQEKFKQREDSSPTHFKNKLILMMTILVILLVAVGAFEFWKILILRRRLNFYRWGKGSYERSLMRENLKFNKQRMLKKVIWGKVMAVGDKKFTIEYEGKPKEVQISDETRFPLDSKTEINVGDTVEIWGEQDVHGTVQAERIIVNPCRFP